jgi:hypothetical protein|tara:strand:+ start:539 stop:910 length:372 start_codon:yes stop_codon:yes gene_type:complete
MTLEDEFELLWLNWPRRVAKKQARKAYMAARKHTPAAEILEGVERYAKHTQNQENRYILHCATFLNGERWADEYEDSHADSLKRALLADSPLGSVETGRDGVLERDRLENRALRIAGGTDSGE